MRIGTRKIEQIPDIVRILAGFLCLLGTRPADAVASGETLAPGVEHRVHHLEGPNVVHVVSFPLTDPQYTLQLGFPEQRRNYEQREGVSRIVQRYRDSGMDVVAAVNGSFFGSGLGIVGALASEGNYIQITNSSREILAISASGEPRIFKNVVHTEGRAYFPNGDWLNAQNLNQVRQENSLVCYTPDWGDTTTTTDPGTEVVLEKVNFPLRPGKTVTGTVTGVHSGPEAINTRIPAGGLVLSAREEPGTRLEALAEVGDTLGVRFAVNYSYLNNADFMIGGAGRLLSGGRPCVENWKDYSESFSAVRHPRTVIAWDHQTCWLVTVDGRQEGHSVGMTFEEIARFLKDILGADEAINLDGGGSTTLYTDRVLNSPSDGARLPGTGSERPVANAVLLVRRPARSPFPFEDRFQDSGRSAVWEDRFTRARVIAFRPVGPEGDGQVLHVMDPSGGFETVRAGGLGDRDYAVEAWVYCDLRPELLGEGFERVGLFARDSGNGNFDSPHFGGGDSYLLAFDSDTGRVRPLRVSHGEVHDFTPVKPVHLEETGWRRFRIECTGQRICFLVGQELIADVTDTTHPRGLFGIGHHEYFLDNSHMRGAHVEDFRVTSLNSDP